MIDVSIIIPTYKRQDYIRRAIDSALQQVNVSSEVIVVDDNGLGSVYQQNNFRELHNYIKSNKIIYIAHDKNKNGSAARNTGIRRATGNYIAFLDDDDTFEPSKLSKQIKLMEMEASSACLSSFIRVYGTKCKKTKTPDVANGFDVKLLAVDIDTCAGSCLIIRREIIEKIGFFDVSFKRFQDIEYLYRVLRQTKISIADSALSFIYMHQENTKKRAAREIESHHIHFLNKFKKEIDKQSKKNKKYIFNQHNLKIAKAYLKEQRYLKCIKYLFSTTNPIKFSLILAIDLLRYLLNNRFKNAIARTKEFNGAQN